MLNAKILESPFSSQEIIRNLNQHTETLIVSDLRSKKDAQEVLIERDGYCLDDSVLRVSDFWRLWLRRLAPYLNVTNEAVIRALASQYLKTKPFGIELTDSEIESALNFFWRSFPFCILNEHHKVIEDWMTEHEAQKGEPIAWKKWYQISLICTNYLLNEAHCVHSSWGSHVLSAMDLNLIQWKKKIIVDLSAEMTRVELGIFETLASRIEIDLVVPPTVLLKRHRSILKLYEKYLTGKTPVLQPRTVQADSEGAALEVKRFSSALTEIKFIVAQVSDWLSAGVRLGQIMLTSPQLKNYWPILKFHLDLEGISTDFPIAARFSDLEIFQGLRARLRLLSKQVDWSTVEQVARLSQVARERLQNQFQEFKSKFFELTEFEELQFNLDWSAQFNLSEVSIDRMTRSQFAQLIVVEFIQANDSSSSGFESRSMEERIYQQNISFFTRVLKEFLAKSIEIELHLASWLEIFFEIIDRMDFTIDDEPIECLKLRELNAACAIESSYRIIFGCDQKSLSLIQNTMISGDDLRTLRNELDFDVHDGEDSHPEFYLSAMMVFPSRKQITTVSHTGLKGEILETPALLLQFSDNPDTDFDERNKLYQIQKELAETTEKAEGEVIAFRQRIKSQFLRDASNAVDPIPDFKVDYLSATSLSDFTKCRFKFFASHLARIRVPDVESVDLSALKSGRILHAVFDFLSQQNFKTDGLSGFLEELRQSQRIYLGFDVLWNQYKEKLTRTAERFCAFELERGANRLTRFSELAFDFCLKVAENEVRFKGSIDRVDLEPESKSLTVLDYKNSKPSVTSPEKMLSKGEYQLFVYIAALMFSDLKSKIAFESIQDAKYFVIKNFSFQGGLKSKEDVEDYLAQFQTILVQEYEQILRGVFPPREEKDEQICGRCDWRDTCRAHHLN